MVDLGKYRQAMDKAVAWLGAQQQPDGSLGEAASPPAVFIYKSAYALGTAGRVEQAGRLLGWIRDHMLDANGQLADAGADGITTYRISWIAQGAHRLAWFDVSRPFLKWLLDRQAPCGGFLPNADAGDVVDTICTWAGMAALYLGDVDAAERTAAFMQSMIEQQPDPARFYHQMTFDGRLCATGDQAPFVDTTQPAQAYYHLGIPMVLLARLYLTTGTRAYLDSALALYDVTRRCAPDAYAYITSAKGMVGTALLYRILGRQDLLDAAVSMADYLARTQHDEGWWTVGDDARVGIKIDATAEFCIFLGDLLCTLAGTPAAT